MCRLFSTYLAGLAFGCGLERSVVDHRGRCAIRQAEVGAAKTMIERTEERFGLKPERLVGDTAYGAAPMLNWLVEEKGLFSTKARLSSLLFLCHAFRAKPRSTLRYGLRFGRCS